MKTTLGTLLFALTLGASVASIAATLEVVRPENDNSKDTLVSCGLKGDVKERRRDCAQKNGDLSERIFQGAYSWSLISKTEESLESNGDEGEVWLEGPSQLVWLRTQQKAGTFTEAQKACASIKAYVPTVDQFQTANEHGLTTVVPGFKSKLFWTSTTGGYKTSAYFFNGTEGYVDDGSTNVNHRIRCGVDLKDADKALAAQGLAN